MAKALALFSTLASTFTLVVAVAVAVSVSVVVVVVVSVVAVLVLVLPGYRRALVSRALRDGMPSSRPLAPARNRRCVTGCWRYEVTPRRPE
jgi:hypothetical protein